MSASPPLTPPSVETARVVSPVGEPDVERELTPRESVRERADGGASPPPVQKAVADHEMGKKEKEIKSSEDLDKDIDAMLEYNTGGSDADSRSFADITVDSAIQDSSVSLTSIAEKEYLVNGINSGQSDIADPNPVSDTDKQEDSEKSFTSISTTNSSVLAEAVVNRVLSSAVKIAKEAEDLKVRDVEGGSGDSKVGLFQYKADDTESESVKAGEEETAVGTTLTEPGDLKVGLFQYFDEDEEYVQKSLAVDSNDEIDEKLESLNLSDQENILQLYGLGGPEVTESREMSTPHASPRTEEETREFFIDVQREIYEPQKRMFSVSQDKSSTESTPRDNVTEIVSPRERDKVEIDYNSNSKQSDIITETISDTVSTKINRHEDQGEAKEQKSDVFEREGIVDSGTAGSQPVSIEVAPPLIHYESVKENGKFRIIKSGGSAFGAIRVGSDISPGQSPELTPRETKTDVSPGQSQDLTQRETKTGVSPGLSLELTQRETISDAGTASEIVSLGVSVNEVPKVEVVEKKDRRADQKDYKRNKDTIDQMEKPLDSVSQTLPIVTAPFTSAGAPWSHDVSQMSRSTDYSKPVRHISGASANEPDRSRTAVTVSRSQAQSFSQRESSQPQRPDLLRNSEPDPRINYSTTDTSGRENKRTGPVPYRVEDYRDVPEKDHSLRRNIYDSLCDESGRYPTPYEAELIQSAYNRVADLTGKPVPGSARTTTVDSGPIPGYKTLQEQQARWSSMFRTLEEQHKTELKSQYERHQYNIQRLQQQMETELQKQHQTIRKKLDIHKEALRNFSPERDSLSPERGFKSPDREQRLPAQGHRSPAGDHKSSPHREPRSPVRDRWSPAHSRRSEERDSAYSVRSQVSAEILSPVRSQRSPERSRDRRSRSADGSMERQEAKTWREIYKEVRQEEEIRDPTPPPPIRRSLEGDFDSIENTTLSRSSLNRSSRSPRGRVSPGRDRISPERDRVSLERDSGSLDRSRLSVDRSRDLPERDQAFKESSRISQQETPERLMSGAERQSRSRIKRSPPNQPVPSLALEKDDHVMTSPIRPTAISPHVQELLDNLNEGRSSLQLLQSPPTGGSGRPRAGVYSSPMPLLVGKGSKSSQTLVDASTSLDASRSESYNESRTLRTEIGRRSREADSRRFEDTSLSSSLRMNLREKHSKHLADLRSYYEEELRELRRGLTDSLDTSGTSVDQTVHSSIQNQLLEAENKHLLDKCRAMEDELEDVYQRIRELEQKGKGLEKRASEYAAAFADSQAMGVQNRAHIEELQRYCRERDDLVSDLESKIRSQEDATKIYKKNLDEELELHRQDKSALQRIIDKYESMEREHKLLHETVNAAENKLYDTRTEVVDLTRTISKLELENKRLGRENDNLRHKVTQSINLTSLHESFGNPPSPRQQEEPPVRRQTSSPVPFTSLSTDVRVPSFTGTPEPRPHSAGAGGTRNVSGIGRDQQAKKSKSSDWKDGKQKKSVSDSKYKERSSKTSSSREDLTQRPRSRQQEREPSQERQKRDTTPPRTASSTSDTENGDYSPLIKAERELYKLRDMMRQAVAVKPATTPPPEPVLQKKFYGSERPSSKDEYIPDLGSPRGVKDKPTSSHKGVAKTKPSAQHSRTERSTDKDKSSRKSASKSDKNSKSKSQGFPKEKSKEADRQQTRTPTKKDLDKSGISVKPDEFNSPTRFDVDVNEDTKTISVRKVPLSGKQKNLFAESDPSAFEGSHDQGSYRSHDQSSFRSHDEGTQTNDQDGSLQTTLDRMRAGNYTTRPQWEDVYTSLAKPKPGQEQKVKTLTREDKIKDTIRNINDMEHRYDELHAEKRQLESSLTKVPIHGRVDRNSRRHKEELEDRLDAVEKELGSLRMSLKRCNVLKTAG